jgi:GH25 family lysozyme M1 (1,4-beta-N-acetylmuramidase)
MLKTKKEIWIYIAAAVAAVALPLTVLLLLLAISPPVTEPPGQTTPTTQETMSTPEESVLTPMDFAYDGQYLTCLSVPSVLGIDVSTHQKQIDWELVKASGVEFVMIRVGYRGTDLGGIYEDERAQRYYEEARAAGLQVGGYFFSQAVSAEEAQEEAEFALRVTAHWEMDMPLAYDWEYVSEESRTAYVDDQTLIDCTKAFCRRVAEGGREPMVYFNPNQSRKEMYLQELKDYGFWLAMYSMEMNYPYKVDMWQYTADGLVPGVVGPVDINLYFLYE